MPDKPLTQVLHAEPAVLNLFAGRESKPSTQVLRAEPASTEAKAGPDQQPN